MGLMLGLVVAGAVAGMGACGDSAAVEEPDERISPAAASPGLDAVDPDEPLVIAVRGLPRGLDPLGDLAPWAARIADDLVFEGLMRRDPQAHPWARPALADRCVPDDAAAPRRVTCRIPSGRTFHDGTPVAAEDVLYSLRWWLDPRRSRQRRRHGLGGLKSVDAVEGTEAGIEIRLTFAQAEPLALERLTTMKIVPRAAHRGRASGFAREPVGTGPMKVRSVDADRLVLERVRGEGPATVVFWAVADGAEAITLLRRGDVHLVDEVAPVHVPAELAKPAMAPRFVGYVLSPPHYDLLLYNVRSGSLSHAGVRKALDLALPRPAIARDRGGAPAAAVDAPVDRSDPVEIDLAALAKAGAGARWGMAGLPLRLAPQAAEQTGAEAAAILDGLGYTLNRGRRRKGESTLRLALMWDGARGTADQTARAVRKAWQDLGVVVPFAIGNWAYLQSPIAAGSFDVAMVRFSERSDVDLRPYFHSRGEANFTGVSDAALDEALDAYRQARDRAGRKAAKQAIAVRLAALRPVSVLYAPTRVLLASRRLQGLEFVDDLPRLDRLVLGPPNRWSMGPADSTDFSGG